MPEPISKEAFAAVVAERGLNLTPERFAELHEAYGFIQQVRERLRNPRGYDAEPASVFSPGAY